MIETKIVSVMLNINPKYLHRDLLFNRINEQLKQIIENNCFQDLGKVLKIKKVVSIGYGKIHIDTGYSKIPVSFQADICLPKIDEVIKGKIERYDSNGGIYVNYNDLVSIFCLKTNINNLLNRENKENCYEIGDEVTVKITKVNFNEQDMIIIGKII